MAGGFWRLLGLAAAYIAAGRLGLLLAIPPGYATAIFPPAGIALAALLVEGLTSKLIGRHLGISPRTVDVYRARLMRKYEAATTPELVNRLLSR